MIVEAEDPRQPTVLGDRWRPDWDQPSVLLRYAASLGVDVWTWGSVQRLLYGEPFVKLTWDPPCAGG